MPTSLTSAKRPRAATGKHVAPGAALCESGDGSAQMAVMSPSFTRNFFEVNFAVSSESARSE
jgi:hypothetical protein